MCDGTHKTWPIILDTPIGIFLVYNPAHSLFRRQFCRQAHPRMAKLVLMALLACALSSPSPQKKHPLKLGHDLRGHKQLFWLPQWQKKQLIYRGKPSQLKDLKVCHFDVIHKLICFDFNYSFSSLTRTLTHRLWRHRFVKFWSKWEIFFRQIFSSHPLQEPQATTNSLSNNDYCFTKVIMLPGTQTIDPVIWWMAN